MCCCNVKKMFSESMLFFFFLLESTLEEWTVALPSKENEQYRAL